MQWAHGFAFAACWSFLSYHDPWVERAVHAIKFGGRAKCASVLGAECAARWSVLGLKKDTTTITAIPLSKKRERERGFNQAECIARALSERSGLSYQRLLQRKKLTKAQAKLSAEERQKNVEDAFQIAPTPRGRGIPIPRNLELSGKTIILIDDVVTTGATLNEAARMLKVSGAGRVIAVTVAYSDIRLLQ